MRNKNTPEQIAKHYSAILDSVNLIKKGKLTTATDKEWEDSLERNKEHLRIMVDKDFWTDEDMTEINVILGV